MTMHGLGDAPPQLTDAQLATYMKMFAAAGGCSGSTQANFAALQCLNNQYLQVGGACLLGRTPVGLTDLEFAGACMALGKCGLFTKPGCPQDSAIYLNSFPTCLNSDVKPLVEYCKSTPQFNGSNRQGNAACWAISRYQDVFQRMMNLGPCPSPTTSVAPPVYQAPPPSPSAAPAPPVMTAQPAPPPPVYQEPPTAAPPPASSESTPGPIDVGPPEYAPVEQEMTPHATEQSSMMMWGLAGAAALGLGYLIFRKK
jgi:hypothetical protein